MVGGVGDESLGEFVQGYSDGGLEADTEEGVCGDVVVMMLRILERITFVIVVVGFVIVMFVRSSGAAF